jgi:hypothetical protein
MDSPARINAECLNREGKRTVNAVVEEIFTVFENVRSLLTHGNNRYHMTFIREVMRLQRLEVELNDLGYDDDFVMFVLEHVYTTVFKYNTYKGMMLFVDDSL